MANKHQNAVRLMVNITKNELKFVDELVNKGIFLSRADCIRGVLRIYKYKYEKKQERNC